MNALCTVQRHLGRQLFDGISKKLSKQARLGHTEASSQITYNNVRLLSPPISKVVLIQILEFLEDSFFSLWTINEYLITGINSAWMSVMGA